MLRGGSSEHSECQDNNEEDDDDEDNSDDDPCSFEEILLANNISLGSNEFLNDKNLTLPPMGSCNALKYNIVSEIEDDPVEEKISNVPVQDCTVTSPYSVSFYSCKKDNENCLEEQVDLTRLGSPRNRRPFIRTDYSRVSDLSFLSSLEEGDVDPSESFSEIQDSEDDLNDRSKTPSNKFNVSMSEVYL